MARKNARRRFGWVRKLPSGRYQASYLDPDGIRRLAPDTFGNESEAGDWLTVREAELLRGEWRDPDKGKVLFGGYADTWITERSGLRPRTVELYRWLLGKYLRPTFGGVHLVDIDTASVRRWRHNLISEGVSATMAAKAYRLLRAILMTAVEDDGLIARNPCRIRRAGSESAAERPVLTIPQVYALADQMPGRFRALVLVATFASLRYGELTALERQDIDVGRATVRVRQAYTELRGQGMQLGPPKSVAGRRVVSLPAAILPEVERHLSAYVGAESGALVFAGEKGGPIRRGNLNKLTDWSTAVAKIGAPGLHFHDLRHTGNTLAADSGASTRSLMARMGHDSMNAAIIYQHASSTADRAIANAISDALDLTDRSRAADDDDPDDGSGGAEMPAS